MNWNEWKPFRWRLLLTALGLLVAILFLTLGFARTVLILLCCAVGFVLGICRDKGISLVQKAMLWRERWK